MPGERPVRVLLTLLGLDQHEAGAFAVARLLRDAGMEVIYLGRFGVPEAIADSALEEDVDLIGLSCHSWEYLYYLDELLEVLKDRGSTSPLSSVARSSAPATRATSWPKESPPPSAPDPRPKRS